MNNKFHNPYNFIPAPPRDTKDENYGDSKPLGHHKLVKGAYSGRLKLRMVVKTPVFIPDMAKARSEKDHDYVPTRVNADGEPVIPASGVMGSLRNAYEALTNSRFGVFEAHDKRLGYRMDTDDARCMVPARIEKDAKGKLQVRLLRGTNNSLPGDERGRNRPPLYAAWLPQYRKRATRLHLVSGGIPEHGKHVYCWVKQYQSGNRFKCWEVVEIAASETELSDQAPESSPAHGNVRYESTGQSRKIEGYVFISNKNMNNKHDERVFFDQLGPDRCLSYQVSQRHASAWETLIAEYRSVNEEQRKKREQENVLPGLYQSDTAPGMSPQQYDPSYQKLSEGTLCYAFIDGSKKGQEQLHGLFPVQISRDLYQSAPIKLVPDSLLPAKSLEELSPADRVFGWSSQDGHGSYKKHLSLSSIRLASEKVSSISDFGLKGLPLTILSTPKPNQVGFYTAADKSGTALTSESHSNYSKKQGLRGRKVFPHHTGLPQDYWEPSAGDESARPRSNKRHKEYIRVKDHLHGNRDNQNRSLLSWVNIGSAFEFHIDFFNLTKLELGALIWMLSLNDNPKIEEDCHFKIGGGKPLGFGSVTIEITDHEVVSNANQVQAYRSLARRKRTDPKTLRDDFEKSMGIQASPEKAVDTKNPMAMALAAAMKNKKKKQGKGKANSASDKPEGDIYQVLHVESLIRSMSGHIDKLPTHYPRGTPGPSAEGENFKWFVENKRRKTAFTLPDINKDNGLPYL